MSASLRKVLLRGLTYRLASSTAAWQILQQRDCHARPTASLAMTLKKAGTHIKSLRGANEITKKLKNRKTKKLKNKKTKKPKNEKTT